MKPSDYSEAGWGVVFSQHEGVETRYRLSPLLNLRREQAQKLYKELVYLAPESPHDFLHRHGVTPAFIDPKRIPLHLLVAGVHEAIPLEFDRALGSLGYEVSRISRSGTEDYARFALEQVEQEQYGKFIASRKLLTSTDIKLVVEPLQRDLFRHLADQPQELYNLEPRKFEEVIAAVLAELGCEVELTPATRDGGRDILAFFDGPFGDRLCAIVECKRYRSDRPIGVDLVQRFLWVVDNQDRASCGLIATTSSFTSDALLLEKRYQWRLMLKDLEAVRSWLKRAGEFDYSEDRRLWIPKGILKSEPNPSLHRTAGFAIRR